MYSNIAQIWFQELLVAFDISAALSVYPELFCEEAVMNKGDKEVTIVTNSHDEEGQVAIFPIIRPVSTLHATQISASSSSHHPPSPPAPTHTPFQVRYIKLDFPCFDGSDVMNWIFKAEQVFDYYHTPDNNRLTIAAVHMEKHVVPWFQMIFRNQPFQSWAMFTRALELEFGPSPYEAARPTLFKLTQQTTVTDYYSSFAALANRSEGLSPEATLDCFISGLKSDIKRDVIAQMSLSLSRAYA
ncbi:hypothetical protein L195_g011765 [Trifolium pratense]|uniref:Retrotransposon gag domain-containing protein n=1 Tax=Trifolium pratense TaxID=57577 RepID=A0A2K3PIJ4_TRIPR|nr:hypothetical protein L195_g011765 [Trifolium pratense]